MTTLNSHAKRRADMAKEYHDRIRAICDHLADSEKPLSVAELQAEFVRSKQGRPLLETISDDLECLETLPGIPVKDAEGRWLLTGHGDGN